MDHGWDRDRELDHGHQPRNEQEVSEAYMSEGQKPEQEKGSADSTRHDQVREANGQPASRSDRHKNRKSRLKKILLAAGGALLLLLAGVVSYAYSLYTDVQEPQRILLDEVSFEQENDRENDQKHDVGEAFSNSTVNIAMLGFDRGWGREKKGEDLFRPDMLALFSIDLASEEVSVVRITRDAYVPIHGMGGRHDKINHSYFYGHQYGDGDDRHQDGIKYTLKTISHVLGNIPIHYYVSVDMYSVVELVDAFGGIYYEVEETIYDKHWEYGRVLVPEGPQVMDGKTYLRYLQYRDEATDQDYGRIDRQMSLLKDTFLYLRDQGRLTDIPTTYRIYKDYVETDLSYTQIASLAYFARDLKVRDLHFYTLPGDGQTRDGIWYQILRQDERLEIIKEVFGVEAERWPPIVLEDSPEYIEEQERKRREEERENRFWNDDRPSLFDREEPEEEEESGQLNPPGQSEESGTGEEEAAGEEEAGEPPQESQDELGEEEPGEVNAGDSNN